MRFLLIFLLLSILSIARLYAPSVPSSCIFSYDDLENAKGCHVKLEGNARSGLHWHACDAQLKDIPYHQAAWQHPIVIQNFMEGIPIDPGWTEHRITNTWMTRFAEGHPHGGLTIFDSESQRRIGYVSAGLGEERGVSNIGYTLMEEGCASETEPTIWGKGIASSVVNALVTRWAPEVMRIGRDETLGSVCQKFRCFNGGPLERFYATASINNPGSWKVLRSNGFYAVNTHIEATDEPVKKFVDASMSPTDIEQALVPLFDSRALMILLYGKLLKSS